jgi:protein-disulfide isomerase/uncharacterized membrane protein
MQESLILNDKLRLRMMSFFAGLGMMVASVLTIRYYFAANFPSSIFEGSFCDISAFLNCDSSAYSVISQVAGVPLGYFGLVVGGLVSLGALFPSAGFERTNKAIASLNAFGVVALLLYSVLYLKSLCLLCGGYYVFGIASFILFWKYGFDREKQSFWLTHFRPSYKHVLTFGVVTLVGAYGFSLFHDAKEDAQSGGVAARVVKQYYDLPELKSPSIISPFMSVKSTDTFEDSPIRIIEYGDFLCPDCLYLTKQIDKLKQEFAGKMNVAFQFFPLDAGCNGVVDKDKHPGACELSYIAAHDPGKFIQIHDEIFDNLQAAKNPKWRKELAKKYQVEEALDDPKTKELVHRIIKTGTEYEKTSDTYAHGIRSTPTMILNNRMIIGTLPYEQLRAIFQALVDEQEDSGKKKFLENWVETEP